MPNKKKSVPAAEPSVPDERMNSDNESTSSSSDDDDDDDSPHPDAYTGSENVQVDFEGRAPVDPDCHGISQLLSRLFLKAHINCMQLADLIIGQNYVGSVIAQCESDEAESDADDDMCEDGTIFGITTVLNVTAKQDVDCIKQLVAYILDRAKKHATEAVFKQLSELVHNKQQHVGVLINERFINIPVDISVPLLESLHTEIEAAKKKQMKFDFTHLLMIVKFYRKEAKKGRPAEDIYTNAEEEVLCSNAANSFEYSVADECDMGISGDWLEGDASLTPYRKVIVFDAKQLPKLTNEIKKFIRGD